MDRTDNRRVVTFGEVMGRFSAPGYSMLTQASCFEVGFAGSEANVAVSLANYGMEVDYFTSLPDNPIADRCIRELRGFGVGVDRIVRTGERLGIMYQETGSNNRPSRVFYDRAGSAFATLNPNGVDWHRILEGATWLHWSGITPALSDSSARLCSNALRTASEQGITISCDINFRRNLWRYGKKANEVMPFLLEHCDVIIGNEEDCGEVLGISPQDFDVEHTGGQIDPYRFESVCQRVMQRFPRCTKVALTLREAINANHNTWGAVLYDGFTLLCSPRYDITDIVDRVGAGDSFSAGLIFGLLVGYNPYRALEFATAASCLKHTIRGDYNMVSVADIQRLMQGSASGRVVR